MWVWLSGREKAGDHGLSRKGGMKRSTGGNSIGEEEGWKEEGEGEKRGKLGNRMWAEQKIK